MNSTYEPRPICNRWPKSGDDPFKKATHSQASGPLDADGDVRAVFMAEGFMRAGAALADLALREPIRRFELVYPMVFCYRHAIELNLKWIIMQYEQGVTGKPPDNIMNHNLSTLWTRCTKLFDSRGEHGDKDGHAAVKYIVSRFHQWDDGSMNFRYATSKDGSVLPFEYPDLDIENLKDVMCGVGRFFKGADGWLDCAARKR